MAGHGLLELGVVQEFRRDLAVLLHAVDEQVLQRSVEDVLEALSLIFCNL